MLDRMLWKIIWSVKFCEMMENCWKNRSSLFSRRAYAKGEVGEGTVRLRANISWKCHDVVPDKCYVTFPGPGPRSTGTPASNILWPVRNRKRSQKQITESKTLPLWGHVGADGSTGRKFCTFPIAIHSSECAGCSCPDFCWGATTKVMKNLRV